MQHQFSDVEIADDAIFEGPHRDDIRGRATNHPFGVCADGKWTFRLGIDRNNGGLVDNDALATYQHQSVGRAKVDANVTGEHAHDTVEGIA